MRERRRQTRHSVRADILIGAEPTQRQYEVVNFSTSGVRLRGAPPLAWRSVQALRLRAPHTPVDIVLAGRVIWSIGEGDDTQMGLEFIEVSRETRRQLDQAIAVLAPKG